MAPGASDLLKYNTHPSGNLSLYGMPAFNTKAHVICDSLSLVLHNSAAEYS